MNETHHNMMNMQVGDRIAMDHIEILRMPGSWVVAFYDDGVVTAATTVSDPLVLAPPKKKSTILRAS